MNKNNLLFYLSILSVSSLLYLFNNIIFKKITIGIINYFFICYFNDVLAPIWILSYSNILLSENKKEMVKISVILSFTFCCGLIWEFFAPLIKKTSVTDIIDLFAYLFGGLIFWFIQKLHLNNNKTI